jgi:hypothetical protein
MKKITFCIVLLIANTVFASESDDNFMKPSKPPGMRVLAVISAEDAKKNFNLKDQVLRTQWQEALKKQDLEKNGEKPHIVIGEKKSPKTRRFNKKQIAATKRKVKK